MGKRSKFKRIPRDLYRTFDPRAGAAIAPHLAPGTQFIEPCAGAWDLAAQLVAMGHVCMADSDIKPLTPGTPKINALKLKPQPFPIITNPPWSRPLLHKMIEHFTSIAPHCWLLFDADWFHTNQAVPFMPWLTDYVAIGRLVWIPGTTTRGKDNAAWYRFERDHDRGGITAWPLHPSIVSHKLGTGSKLSAGKKITASVAPSKLFTPA